MDYLLLDNARGGSGENLIWSLIDWVKSPFLAGGLIWNVTKLKLKPYAVVSSGVETDGLKIRKKYKICQEC